MLVVIGMLSSCVNTKSITYLQREDGNDSLRLEKIQGTAPYIQKIQPFDLLAINVGSLNEESSILLNQANITPVITSNFPSLSGGGASRTQPLSYAVDSLGTVVMPLIGAVNVANLTLAKAGETIKSKLTQYLKDPIVTVRIVNHKFTVLGEVARPGIYNLNDNTTTIPDVLAIAGDMTIYGRRDNVMVVRQAANGQKEMARIDLRKRDFLMSPYYYIQNNDIVYIEATQGKITSSDRTIQLIPIVTGVASTFLLLMNFLFK
ncbi:hypothetical protein GVN22_25015 [Cellulophaga sp. BC115SP]|nr:hypothetical protein [Cellulophaga sp. BC115SP]